MIRYLNHVTLNTGHNRRSPRDEVSDAIVAACGAHLRRALTAGPDGDPVPGFTAYALRATSEGRLLLGTIQRRSDGMPALTIGVAPKSRGAAGLWTMLLDRRNYPVERGQPPVAPWCAVRFERPDLLTGVADWAGDYERCLAWAWIEGAANG